MLTFHFHFRSFIITIWDLKTEDIVADAAVIVRALLKKSFVRCFFLSRSSLISFLPLFVDAVVVGERIVDRRGD